MIGMSDLDHQIAYWDAVAATKTFTHPLYRPWWDGIDRRAAILDFGCGYGRTMEALAELGFTDLTGVDIAPAMIARARSRHPEMWFDVLDSWPQLDRLDGSVDVVVLFAVLTCIPGDEAQRRLIGELRRVLAPGGILYVSDLVLSDDERSRERYVRDAGRYGTYGVFETGDGAICRHHADDWFPSLLTGFTIEATRRFAVATMNGNQSAGIQLLARKAGT
jgi:SAM-dependent methyltransferase